MPDPNSITTTITGLPAGWLNMLTLAFAAIGGLYALARAIVALTPTPKDDEIVNRVGGWLGIVGKIFGLNLGQGIRK